MQCSIVSFLADSARSFQTYNFSNIYLRAIVADYAEKFTISKVRSWMCMVHNKVNKYTVFDSTCIVTVSINDAICLNEFISNILQ